MKKYNGIYDGWSEYDVKEKGWQIYTLTGKKYVKLDFSGDFINVDSGEVVSLTNIFHLIRNCTDSEGYILAKRKR